MRNFSTQERGLFRRNASCHSINTITETRWLKSQGQCRLRVAGKSCEARGSTVLKPVPGSGSRAECAQFRGSSDAKHVSSWFQPWATLWPTCHMLVPASLLQSVECSTECKNSIFHCTIGCNKYKSSLASGASPQTPPGGLFLPPGPPPPAWVHAAH